MLDFGELWSNREVLCWLLGTNEEQNSPRRHRLVLLESPAFSQGGFKPQVLTDRNIEDYS